MLKSILTKDHRLWEVSNQFKQWIPRIPIFPNQRKEEHDTQIQSIDWELIVDWMAQKFVYMCMPIVRFEPKRCKDLSISIVNW